MLILFYGGKDNTNNSHPVRKTYKCIRKSPHLVKNDIKKGMNFWSIPCVPFS